MRLRRDRIVVALEHKVLSYNFADLSLLHQIETLTNTRGLLALSSVPDATVLACPGLHTGQVRCYCLFVVQHVRPVSELWGCALPTSRHPAVSSVCVCVGGGVLYLSPSGLLSLLVPPPGFICGRTGTSRVV